jgi:hypothetical protein
VTSASGLRVCVWIVPGPVNSITKPSPLLTVLIRPLEALRVVKAILGSKATRYPESTTTDSPAASSTVSSAP